MDVWPEKKDQQDPQLGSPQEVRGHSLAAGVWPTVVNHFMDEDDLYYRSKVWVCNIFLML